MHDLNTIRKLNRSNIVDQVVDIHRTGKIAVIDYTGLNAISVSAADDEVEAQAIADRIAERGIAFHAKIERPIGAPVQGELTLSSQAA
jgi:hypothetical protein